MYIYIYIYIYMYIYIYLYFAWDSLHARLSATTRHTKKKSTNGLKHTGF